MFHFASVCLYSRSIITASSSSSLAHLSFASCLKNENTDDNCNDRTKLLFRLDLLRRRRCALCRLVRLLRCFSLRFLSLGRFLRLGSFRRIVAWSHILSASEIGKETSRLTSKRIHLGPRALLLLRIHHLFHNNHLILLLRNFLINQQRLNSLLRLCIESFVRRRSSDGILGSSRSDRSADESVRSCFIDLRSGGSRFG